MQPFAYNATVEVEELLGEWHPLVDQLGFSEGLLPLSSATAALQLPQVTNIFALELFLESYKSNILIPLELPAILRAFRHTSRNETRELVAFDRQMARAGLMPVLARASRRIGQHQLRRLRPLRDHRLLQRYLRAMEEGRAHGWHTLVYGLTLSAYSLPVLQGLVFYERQILLGFVNAAARYLHLTRPEYRRVLDKLCADLPHGLDTMLPAREWMVTSTR
jgi:urease accessory protein UreF